MIYDFANCRVDTQRFELWRDGAQIPVEPQVMELLILLIEQRERVVTRDVFFETVWKGRFVSDTTLSSRIKAARQAVGDDGTSQAIIRTIRGRGFRFVAEVSPMDDTDTGPATGPSTSPSTPPVPDDITDPPPATHYAKSGDVHVAYHLFGDGPVNLVIAPGFVSHIENYWAEPGFNRMLTRMGKMARVALFDKRGTGLSDPVSTLPGMDERMDDVRAVMDAAGFEQAVIMGISEGGSLAAVFAAHHPARCLGLILYGAFARFTHWFPTPEDLKGLFDYIETSWGTGISLPAFAPSKAGDVQFQQWWGKFERLGATPGNAIALMRMNAEIDISGILGTIRVPTQVIHRAGDMLIDVAGGRELADGIPGAQYAELSGSDHLAWVGDTQSFLDAIQSFLDDLPALTEPERTLATVLVVDGEATRMVDPGLSGILSRYRGRQAGMRDGWRLTTFDGPARALRCARDLLHTFPQARLGLHVGEVDLLPDTVDGVAVTLAMAVAEQAQPGEALVSRTVKDLVAGSGIGFSEAGSHHLTGLAEPWHLFRAAK